MGKLIDASHRFKRKPSARQQITEYVDSKLEEKESWKKARCHACGQEKRVVDLQYLTVPVEGAHWYCMDVEDCTSYRDTTGHCHRCGQEKPLTQLHEVFISPGVSRLVCLHYMDCNAHSRGD